MSSDNGTAGSTRAKPGHRPASGPGHARPRTRDGSKSEATPTGGLVRQALEGDGGLGSRWSPGSGPCFSGSRGTLGLNAADRLTSSRSPRSQLMPHADQVRDPDRIAGWFGHHGATSQPRAAIDGTPGIPSIDQVADGAPAASMTDDVEVLGTPGTSMEPTLERALRGLPGLLSASPGAADADSTPQLRGGGAGYGSPGRKHRTDAHAGLAAGAPRRQGPFSPSRAGTR